MTSPKDPAPVADDAADERIDTDLVRELATILNDTDLTEIEVERGALRIRVARGTQVIAAPVQPATAFGAAAAPAAPGPAAAAAPRGELVKSPMVGTVFLAAQPGAEPFVKVGDKVSEGQTLLIVEAMKTMNPIPSPRAGTVVQLLAQDGQPVEFGEGLLVLE